MTIDTARSAPTETLAIVRDLAPSSARRGEIDGIRGWAALCVLMFHLIWEIFGVIQPSYRSLDFLPLLDGHLAVYVFFVLSGDALSLSFTDSRRDELSPRVVLKRYFRLAGPVLFTCAVSYALMRSGLVFSREAGEIVERPHWLARFLQFDPSLATMLRYGLINAFTDSSGATPYNPMLWTMSIELAGSMLVFCLFPIKRYLRDELVAVSLAAAYLWLLGSLYSLFLVGVCFGLLRDRGVFDRLRSRADLNRAASVAAVAALYYLEKYSGSYVIPASITKIALASLIVFVCYASSDLLAFMRSQLSLYLGRISFSLYLMQFPVIVSFTSWSIVRSVADPDAFWSAPAAIVLSSLALTVAVATLTTFLEGRYLRVVDLALDRFVLTPAGARRRS